MQGRFKLIRHNELKDAFEAFGNGEGQSYPNTPAGVEYIKRDDVDGFASFGKEASLFSHRILVDCEPKIYRVAKNQMGWLSKKVYPYDNRKDVVSRGKAAHFEFASPLIMDDGLHLMSVAVGRCDMPITPLPNGQVAQSGVVGVYHGFYIPPEYDQWIVHIAHNLAIALFDKRGDSIDLQWSIPRRIGKNLFDLLGDSKIVERSHKPFSLGKKKKGVKPAKSPESHMVLKRDKRARIEMSEDWIKPFPIEIIRDLVRNELYDDRVKQN